MLLVHFCSFRSSRWYVEVSLSLILLMYHSCHVLSFSNNPPPYRGIYDVDGGAVERLHLVFEHYWQV